MISPRKGLALVALVLAGFLGLYFYESSHFRIKLSPFTESDRSTFVALVKVLETMEHRPYRVVDDRSIGYPRREDELRVVNQAVLVFEARYQKIPSSLDELPAIINDGPEAESAKRDLRKIANECEIFSVAAHSYVLNCDGWKRPKAADWEAILGTARSNVVKFILVENHILLYSPPQSPPN